MAINSRQESFIIKLKNFANDVQDLYGKAHALNESFAEEFDDAQDNEFLAVTLDLETDYLFSSADVKTAVNQAVNGFINYWTGLAVTTREYGKDLRRVK